MIDTKLYSLVAVQECGSFIGAAKRLKITQPAVSQHVKALEAELGVTVFERVGGNLTVTKQGERVIRCAKKMIGLENALRQELSDGRCLRDRLTVGITHTAESNPIAEALARYSAENEGVCIKLITESISNLYSMLKTYELDMAVVEGSKPDPALRFILLDTDYLALVVSPNHPLAGKNLVTLAELRQERLILRLPDSGTRNLFKAHLENNNVSLSDFNVILELDNVATIKDLIRRDFGVSILPRSVCLDELNKGKLVVLPVENLSMMREMNLVCRSDFSQSEILHDIVKAYNETLRIYK